MPVVCLSSHFIGEEKGLRKVAGSNSLIYLGRIQHSPYSGNILSLNTFVVIIFKVEFVVTHRHILICLKTVLL